MWTMHSWPALLWQHKLKGGKKQKFKYYWQSKSLQVCRRASSDQVQALKTSRTLPISHSSRLHRSSGALLFSCVFFWPSVRHFMSPAPFSSSAARRWAEAARPSFSPRSALKGHRECMWRSGAPGCFQMSGILTFTPGSWTERLSNLQKAVRRGRGWRGKQRNREQRGWGALTSLSPTAETDRKPIECHKYRKNNVQKACQASVSSGINWNKGPGAL